jgi:TRAP-type C4-dicarboxylate transport system substrate-binding protein
MNLEIWNSLPADIQNIIDGMTEDLTRRYDELQVRTDQERIASAPAEFGTEFITLPEEELARWVARDRPVLDKFADELVAAGLPGDELEEEFLRLEKKYSADEYAPK